jgi:hypothetical protein
MAAESAEKGIFGDAMATWNEFGIIPVARGLDGQLMVQKEIPFRLRRSGSAPDTRAGK